MHNGFNSKFAPTSISSFNPCQENMSIQYTTCSQIGFLVIKISARLCDCIKSLSTSSLSFFLQSVADSNAKGVVRRSPRIAAKRARSLADPTIEFEISDSQEVGVTGPAKGRKRRKISIVSRSILV